jgi:predicted phosphodiesterase
VSSIDILVESATPDTVSVEYGLTSNYGLRGKTTSVRITTAGTYVHDVHLAGLDTNTLYHYRVVQGKEKSDDATFRTAPHAGTSFRAAWMADCRTDTTVYDSIAARILRAEPVVSLYGGDLCTDGSYASYKKEFFRPMAQRLMASVPYFNAAGNHEKWDTNTVAFTRGPLSSSGTDAYYSLDYGDLHVLVLNTNLPYDSSSAQYAFAWNDLASARAAWKIVVAHKHPYCAGGHGEDQKLKYMATHLFEPNGVTLMLSGHSHFYQHNRVRGIDYFIVGSAGAPLYNPDSTAYTLRSIRDHNFAILDISQSQFSMHVYNAKGAPLDSLLLEKKVVAPTPGIPQ